MVSALSTATFSSMLLDILNEARLNSFDGIRLALPDACMAKLLSDEDAHRGVDSTVPIQLCHLDVSRVTAALGGATARFPRGFLLRPGVQALWCHPPNWTQPFPAGPDANVEA